MPTRPSSRWLEQHEKQAIIHFISCNPGRTGREIGKFLGLPKKSVNGYLYRFGRYQGVTVQDWRWYPEGLLPEPYPRPGRIDDLAHPPIIRADYPPIPRGDCGPEPDPESPGDCIRIRRENQLSAPKPEWTDEPEVITTTMVKPEPVNLAPVNKQSGWSRMGCLYAGLFVFAALLLVKAARGAELVQVRSCYDGDTCTLNTGEKVRLACFDTPELRGRSTGPMVSIDAAIAARDHLRQMVVGREVSIQRHTTDRYGRTVATLFIDERPVGAEMVRSGHGVVMPRYAHQCSWSR